MSDVEHILASQNQLGEGPVWSIEQQALYWVDIRGQSYSYYHPASGTYETVQVGASIGVLALRAAGGLVMAVKKGFALWDEQERKLHYIARPQEHTSVRFNDGAVDSAGRFWAGTMVEGPGLPQTAGALYRLDPDGIVRVMETGISTSNGIGWSPDDTIMYYTDSPLKVIYAYNFDATNGSISQRRVFVDTSSEAGSPDGLAVDSEGYVWSARWDGAKIVRYAPDGYIDRVISVPILRPTSCAFGGEKLNELYITSASVGEESRALYPLSGDLFRLKTNIRGLPQHQFAGV